MIEQFDIYDEGEEFDVRTSLKNYRAPFSIEPTWNLTILDKFAMVIEAVIQKEFPDAKLTHDIITQQNDESVCLLKISVDNKGFSKSLNLEVEMIRSPKCPAKLPFSIAEKFINIFKKQSRYKNNKK